MKKRKVILSLLLAFVLLLSIAAVAACKDKDDPEKNDPGNKPEPEVGSWELQSITLSGTYKTEYQLNETLSAAGLTVTATMKNIETGATRKDDVTAKAAVDSSRFNSAMVGAYVITVSYTSSNVTRYADYSVKVLPYEPEINGISISKTTVAYSIPSNQLCTSVNVDDITVKAVNANGEEAATPLAADAYTLTYYKGGEKVDDLSAVTRGTYTIQAERKSDNQKAFVIVNVTGGINGIQATMDTTKFEISKEGDTVEINQGDITLTTDLGTGIVEGAQAGQCSNIAYELYAADSTAPLTSWTVGEGTYTVKVTATYTIAANNTVDFTAEITVTVKVAGGPQAVSYKLLSNDLAAETITGEKVWLAADDDGNSVSITASSSNTVVVEGNSKSMDGISFTNRIKLGGAGSTAARSIKITVADTTTITIYAMSSSGSAARNVQLLNASGTAVDIVGKATLDGTTFTDATTVGGEKLHKIVITVEAGTYYFASVASGLNVYGVNLDIGQSNA